jgi:hypothetical protein
MSKSEILERQYFEYEKKETPKIAYVTFRSIEGQVRTLSLYKKGWCSSFWSRVCRTRGYRWTLFKKSHKMRVKQAISPELIKWENLGISSRQRCLRIFVIWFTSFLLIALCFGLIVYLEDLKVRLEEFSKPIECPKETVSMEMAL